MHISEAISKVLNDEFDFMVAFKNFNKSSELNKTHGIKEISAALKSLRYGPGKTVPLTNFLKNKKNAKWKDMVDILQNDMNWKDGQLQSFISLIYQNKEQ